MMAAVKLYQFSEMFLSLSPAAVLAAAPEPFPIPTFNEQTPKNIHTDFYSLILVKLLSRKGGTKVKVPCAVCFKRFAQ
jgi:hypothetical protein